MVVMMVMMVMVAPRVKHPAQRTRDNVVMVMMMMMMMMMILCYLKAIVLGAGRRGLGQASIVGLERRYRVWNRIEKVAVARCRSVAVGLSRYRRVGGSYCRHRCSGAEQTGDPLVHSSSSWFFGSSPQ
jgi:hypothetical protein